MISHAYHAFSICAEEPIFRHYYNADYYFSRPWYFDADENLFSSLQNDPKHLLKQTGACSKDASASPKRLLRTPDKQQQLKQRKGNYNFRKPADAEVIGVGLQRNLDMSTPNAATTAESEEDAGNGNRRDVFANFKFRRNYSKSTNRNYGNINSNANVNANNGVNKDKSVTWTLPGKQATEE